jgi:hypothetical protein
VAKVGERVVSGRLALTIAEVRDPHPAGQYSAPKPGMRWLGLDVIVENTGGAALDYNPFFSRMKTADSREYPPTFAAVDVSPLLQSGTQQVGDSVRGWILFEIPQDAQLATLTYSVYNAAPRVTVDLR